MAETDLHYLRLAGAAYGLRKFLADRDDVYVGSNLMVFDEPGNPRRHLSPDIFVAFGVRSGPRDLFKIWGGEIAVIRARDHVEVHATGR